MNNYKLSVYILFILLCASFASAGILDRIAGHYSMDINKTPGTNYIDSNNTYNGTLTGTLTNVTGIIGQAKLATTPTVYILSPLTINSTSNYTVNAFINVNDTTDYNTIFANSGNYWGGGVGRHSGSDTARSGYYSNCLYNINWRCVSSKTPIITNKWVMYTAVYNHPNLTLSIYINGTLNNRTVIASGGVSTAGTTRFLGIDATNYFIGAVDELAIWTRPLTDDEIYSLYTNITAGYSYPYESPASPVSLSKGKDIYLIKPENATINNTNWYNFTFLVNYSNIQITNCSLYTNMTGSWALNRTNTTAVINVTAYNFTTYQNTTGNFLWNIQCCDNESNCTYALSNYTYTFDSITPLITAKPELVQNKTFIYNGTIDSYINFTDERDIYSISAVWGNGTVIYNGTNLTTTFYQMSINGTVANQGSTNTITARICDSHTNNNIKDIPVDNYNKGLKFVVKDRLIYSDDYINVYPDDYLNYDEAGTIKSKDRYSFKFKKKINPSFSESFIVESSHDITILYTSEYHGHLVISGIGNNGYWVDFENNEATQYQIQQINNNKVRVTVYGLKSKNINFNSIGELNCKTEIFYVNNLQSITGYTTPIVISQNDTITLNITPNASFYTLLNATLYYNNTAYFIGSTANFSKNVTTPTSISGSYENVTLNWLLTIDGVNYNLTQYKQQVYDIGLDNCTLYNTTGINFTYIDEKNGSYIEADVSSIFYYFRTGSSPKTYTLAESDAPNTGICIAPSTAEFSTNYTYIYSNSNYPQRRYYVKDQTTNNATQQKTLYLLESAYGLYGRFLVIDAYGNPIEGVTCTMQKFIGGAYQTIEIEETDGSGTATFWLDPDTDYYFTFYKASYGTVTKLLRVTSSDVITVTLGAGDSIDRNYSYAIGIEYYFRPLGELLNGTTYSFTFNLSSRDIWDITDCDFYIVDYDTDTILSSIPCTYTTDDANATISYNTGTYTRLVARSIYNLNSSDDLTIEKLYIVRTQYTGNSSLKTLITDIQNFGLNGFNNTTRLFLSFVLILLLVLFLSYNMEVRDPEVLIGVLILCVWFFSYINFMYIDYNTPSFYGKTLIGDTLKKYILALLITLAGGAFIIRRLRE